MNGRRAYAVRRLAEAHRPVLMDMLRRDQVNNRFLISRVADFGVSSNRISFWGAFDGPRLAGVAMRMDASASICSDETDCVAGLVPHISPAENLSGQIAEMEAVLALIPANRLIWRQVDWLCWLPAQSFRPATTMGARPATDSDLAGLAALFAQSEGFSRRTAVEVADDIQRQLASCRYFVVEAGDGIASAAAVAGETPDSAMIVSVFTAPEHRNRGLGAAVVSAACASLLARGRGPRLMYRVENDAAGRVYERLGFRQAGKWLLARLAPGD